MKKFHWIVIVSSVIAAITAVFTTIALTACRTNKKLSNVTVDDEPIEEDIADTEGDEE